MEEEDLTLARHGIITYAGFLLGRGHKNSHQHNLYVHVEISHIIMVKLSKLVVLLIFDQ